MQPESQLILQDYACKGKMGSSHGLDETDGSYIPHAIFLSHSGKQKRFAKDLYDELTINSLTTFFDTTHHSLPPGERFPPLIFKAAKSCEVAMVVLSEDFVCSKWPMLELCTFVNAMKSGANLKLVPLFFKLSPADLQHQENVKRWRKAWGDHAHEAHKAGKHPIDVSEWEYAFGRLSFLNGINIFDHQGRSQGERDYIARIVSAVSEYRIPPFVKFSTTHITAKSRLLQVILDKLEKMQCDHTSSRVAVSSPASASASASSTHEVTSVLVLYGLPGSGKTTLCKCLYDHFRIVFGSNRSLYLAFSSNPSNADMVKKLSELLRLTNFRNRVNLGDDLELEQVS